MVQKYMFLLNLQTWGYAYINPVFIVDMEVMNLYVSSDRALCSPTSGRSIFQMHIGYVMPKKPRKVPTCRNFSISFSCVCSALFI